MIKESALDKILYQVKKVIPKPVFEFFQPMYHRLLAQAGAARYGFPSRGMKIIGVTGTKGKSTTVFMITRILEAAGYPVASIGTLNFKIKNKEWPNTLKQSMPGRFRLQKFLAEARKAGCKYVVLEVTSEGIKQFRHLGITFDTAVFTNIHREHLENHGSFEKYLAAKQELFKATKRCHVVNADDKYFEKFGTFSGRKLVTFGIQHGDVRQENVHLQLQLAGDFNILNGLAATAVGLEQGVDLETIKKALADIAMIPGRMEFVQLEPFRVVVDYAHTPDSLEAVYKTLKPTGHRLIGVFGATGGGRDKWKRSEFGAIAEKYCDEIYLTDDDPYEEDRARIVADIQSGIPDASKVHIVLDRREAIAAALRSARPGDTVAITGKGSEPVMAIAGGKKIPWSDREVALESLSR